MTIQDISEDEMETICRAVCVSKGIDPDATGYAITETTLNDLGESYSLWKYQKRFVDIILQLAVNNGIVRY